MEVRNVKNVRSVIVLFLLSICTFMQAQEVEPEKQYVINLQENSYKWDNWAYWTCSLQGGGNIYFGEFDKTNSTAFQRIAPFGKATVARWFSSEWGLRGQLEGGKFKNSAQSVVLGQEDDVFSYMSLSAQVVTNIMNWGRHKRSNRPISVYLYGGLGMAIAPERGEYLTTVSPMGVLGTELNVRMSDYWSLSLDLNGVLVDDYFNNRTGGARIEGYATASLGLTYRFFRYPVRRVK